jgi:uroporphyrinogen III methyltransferase/synthase
VVEKKQHSVGFVSIVGAGPGDPELLTLKAERRLKEADVVVTDALVPMAIPEIFCEKALIVDRRTVGDGSQAAINSYLIREAMMGRRVVRLKGGDPFVFGRGGEEALALVDAEIPFEVVPGVSSGLAVPAYAGIPVTHRHLSSNVHFVTGHEDSAKLESSIQWDRIVDNGGTLVVFMGVRTLDDLIERLVSLKVDPTTPVAVIEWGTTPRQRTVVGDLTDIVSMVERDGLDHPALVVVGRVVSLRHKLAWFDQRPLWGRRVLVTRAKSQAPELVQALRDAGAGVLRLPVLAFAPPTDPGILARALDELEEGDRIDWALFTSANGVVEFWNALSRRNLDMRVLANARVACVGPATSRALAERGIQADVVPEESRAEGLLRSLPSGNRIRGMRFMLFRAEVGRDVIPDALRSDGGIVDVVPTYRTVRTEVPPAAARQYVEAADTVTFTSPSSVNNLVSMLGEEGLALLSERTLAAIGPITAKALAASGLVATVVGRVYTVDGLVEALVDDVLRP